ncbi:MAG: hypothetical protein GX664_00340 [Bacteroidales bacterium]|nr:hypothetical protein [Bacteroidales bacterium]
MDSIELDADSNLWLDAKTALKYDMVDNIITK